MQKKSNNRLEEAIVRLVESQATLVQNQASFVAQLRETDRQMAEIRRETAERFANIEQILLRLVEVLPEAVRDKIGIKPKQG